MINLFKRILHSYHQFLIFGMIGSINVLVHSSMVIALVEGKLTDPVAANTLGFIGANTFSFFANCWLTFKSPPSRVLYRKFVLVSLTSLVLVVGLTAFAEWMKWCYLAGLLLVIILGPLLTFLLHKTVGFKNRFKRIPQGYYQFLIFGLIGVFNTLVHSGIVIALVEGKLAGAVAANTLGFIGSNTFSFFMNCRLTFKSPPSRVLYRKFVLVSLTSLVMTVSLSLFAESMKWHYLAGLLLVIIFGPLLTFFLHKTYAFKNIQVAS
ncbi:MAG: GtrA family protein [Methylobacter sp.]